MARKRKTENVIDDNLQKFISVCNSDLNVEITDLDAWDINPRVLDKEGEEKLDKSLIELGLFRNLLVWEHPERNKLQIIGGNQRFKRLKSLNERGFKFKKSTGELSDKIPVTKVVCDEAKARLIALRDNNNDGDWDYSLLSGYLNELEDMLTDYDADADLDMALAGFDDDLLSDLIDYANDSEVKVLGAAAKDPIILGDEGVVEGADEDRDQDEMDEKEKKLQDDEDSKIVSVVIGHVRGRLSHPTYARLIDTLAMCIPDSAREGGLDIAFSTLLDAFHNLNEEKNNLG